MDVTGRGTCGCPAITTACFRPTQPQARRNPSTSRGCVYQISFKHFTAILIYHILKRFMHLFFPFIHLHSLAYACYFLQSVSFRISHITAHFSFSSYYTFSSACTHWLKTKNKQETKNLSDFNFSSFVHLSTYLILTMGFLTVRKSFFSFPNFLLFPLSLHYTFLYFSPFLWFI